MPNAAWRLVDFFSTLRKADGTIAIEGFADAIATPTATERAMMEAMPFDESQSLHKYGLTHFAPPDGVTYMEKIMFRPTLNICGIASGYGGEGSKTVIPSRAMAKIDIRLVMNQDPEDIFNKLVLHARAYGFADIEFELLNSYHPSRTPVDHPFARRFTEAVRKGFGEEPVLVPSAGGSFPGAAIRNVLGTPMFDLPYGNADENNHAPDENLSIACFRNGIRTSAALLAELAA